MATTLAPPTERPDAPAVVKTTSGRPRLRHVGALDGLRGIAVLAVIVYHLDDGVLPGGFLGVSLFFTLSGFLITNLLLGEWEGTHRVGLGHFWNRRFRRLLPAALAGLALATLTAAWWADANQLANLRADVAASLAYVANWRFIFNGDGYGAGLPRAVTGAALLVARDRRAVLHRRRADRRRAGAVRPSSSRLAHHLRHPGRAVDAGDGAAVGIVGHGPRVLRQRHACLRAAGRCPARDRHPFRDTGPRVALVVPPSSW